MHSLLHIDRDLTGRSTRRTVPGSTRHPGAALAVVASAQFLVVMSTSIVNVALPSIADGMDMSRTTLSWVVNAYVLAFGALLLLGGRVADVFGRRRMFAVGTVGFAGASVAAGLAPSTATLLAARTTQGVAAALLAPAALGLVLTMFPSGPERARALGVWGAVSGVGGAAGVLLSGVLTETLGWRAVFLVGAPIALGIVALTRPLVPADRARGGTVDLPGAVTVTAGLAAIVYALTSGPDRGWSSPVVVGATVAGVALLGAFWRIQRRSSDPLVPPRLLVDRRSPVLAANVTMALLGAIWIGLFYFLPLYQRQVLGYSALSAAVAQVPMAATITLASSLAPRFAGRRALVWAFGVLAVGLVWLGRAPVDGRFLTDLLGPSLLIGAGLGVAFVRLTSLATAGVLARDSGVAGGLVNTTRQVGGAIGLAALTAVASGQTSAGSAGLATGHGAAFLAGSGIAVIGAALVRLTLPDT